MALHRVCARIAGLDEASNGFRLRAGSTALISGLLPGGLLGGVKSPAHLAIVGAHQARCACDSDIWYFRARNCPNQAFGSEGGLTDANAELRIDGKDIGAACR